MKFSEFRHYQPKSQQNVFVFVCEDDLLVEESQEIWTRIFNGSWVFERITAKEFEEIPLSRLMEDALTPSLFARSRALMVSNADKLTKGRLEDLAALRDIPNSSLKVVLVCASRKAADASSKAFSIVEIDALKPSDISRWLVERHKLKPEVARYLVDAVGTDLYQLDMEVQKLTAYVADARPIEIRDVDVLILRSEQFGPFELDDAILARDYKKAVLVTGAMLDEGTDPLVILARVARVWRQLFIGKSLASNRSARDLASAVLVPAWKAGDFAASCRKFDWKQLGAGFREFVNADRALKTSTPNVYAYFDVMLWKLLQP